jgi:hypothetical protein
MQHSHAVAPPRSRYSSTSPLRPIPSSSGGSPVGFASSSSSSNTNTNGSSTTSNSVYGRHSSGGPTARPASGTYYNHPQHKIAPVISLAATAPLLPPLSTSSSLLSSPTPSMSISPSSSAASASQPPMLSPLGPMTAMASPSAPLMLSPNNMPISPLSMSTSSNGQQQQQLQLQQHQHQQSSSRSQRFARAVSNDHHNMVAVT